MIDPVRKLVAEQERGREEVFPYVIGHCASFFPSPLSPAGRPSKSAYAQHTHTHISSSVVLTREIVFSLSGRPALPGRRASSSGLEVAPP